MVRSEPRSLTASAFAEAAPVFAALGDETRLRIVARLCRGGPASISRLTESAEVSRQAVTKHLRALEDAGLVRSGRAGRTLAKSGRMRVTLVAMVKGNVIGTHLADSPLTLHVLSGHIRFRAGGEDHELGSGQLLFFGPGDAHDLTATEDSALLLTLSAIGDDFAGEDGEQGDPQKGLLLG